MSSNQGSGNQIDDLANRLVQEGRADQLESELKKFDPSTLEEHEKESWYHYFGAIAFHDGNRSLAFQRFQEGIKQCPDSGAMCFSLGQEYEFRGEIENMFVWFDKAVFPKVSPSFALVEARYAYLWDRADKGWVYLEPLMNVYFDLKVLDPTFLHIRGIPSFEQVCFYLAAFSQMRGDFTQLYRLTRKAEAECIDFDFDYLKMQLEGFQSEDFASLMEWLLSTIERLKSKNLPYGYFDLRLKILRGQQMNDIDEAKSLLDNVQLTTQDFPWLEDMRLLAKCELEHRAGNRSNELELRRQFLHKQPMLFEPDNAINFNLLAYQENLKPDYQKSRM